VGVYQQKVLVAAQEVDDGIAAFLQSREQAEYLAQSVDDASRAVEMALTNFQAGSIDYTPVFIAQQFLSERQNDMARAQGNIALGLISVYRALGGGWELRLDAAAAVPGSAVPVKLPALEESPLQEPLPTPMPLLGDDETPLQNNEAA
jgi:outer membrane protein TolC